MLHVAWQCDSELSRKLSKEGCQISYLNRGGAGGQTAAWCHVVLWCRCKPHTTSSGAQLLSVDLEPKLEVETGTT